MTAYLLKSQVFKRESSKIFEQKKLQMENNFKLLFYQ